MSAPKVIGLDLSITATGIALADGSVATISPLAKHGDRRLNIIRDALLNRPIDLLDADLVVIEGPVVRSSAAVIIGMVHGTIRTLLNDHNTPYAVIPPATLKKYATGKGNADKTAMALALYKRTRHEFDDDNQVDAWWLRAAGLHHLGHPPCGLPAANRDALDKIAWPALPSSAGSVL